MNKHFGDRWKLFLVLFLVCLSISMLIGFELINVLASPAPSRNTVVTPGSNTTNCDYTFYVDGSTYLAKNGNTGDNDFSSTNITSVMQNAVITQGAGQYCFDSGTYDFANGESPPTGLSSLIGSVKRVGMILPAKSTLQCGGYNTILTSSTTVPGSPTSNDYFVMITNQHPTTNDGQIIIQNCFINLPTPSQSATGLQAWDDGIVFAGVHDSQIRNVQITNGGIELYPNSVSVNAATVLVSGQNFNNLIQSTTMNSQTGNTVLYQAVNSTIQNSAVNGLWDDGFIIASAGLNNKIIGNSVNGQAVVNGKGALTAGIYIQNDGAVCAQPKTSCLNGNIIANNDIYNVTGHNSGTQSGIKVLNAQNTIIDSNLIHGNAGWGIDIENANNTMIRGDIAYLNTKDGVRIETSANSIFQQFTVANGLYYDNGVNGQGNAGILITTNSGQTLKNINILGNLFYDDLASARQANAIRFGFDGTLTGLLVEGNNFLRSPGAFQNGGAGTISNLKIANNIGYNPVGKITNFICSTLLSPGIGISCGTTIVASTTYTVLGPDMLVTSTGGTGVSINVGCGGNNYVAAAATITNQLIWQGCTINFGAFSVVPTVTVFGN